MCAEAVKTEFSEPETPQTAAAPAQLTCAVLVRNGVRDLPGWLAWHLALGVQEIVVIDAGSTDGTQELVAALGEEWPIRLLSFTVPTSVDTPDDCRIALTQAAMQTLAESVTPSKDSALQWGLVLDVDEYLAPATDLPTLLKTAATHSAFPLHWRQFGTSGHTSPQFGHVVATHVQGAPNSHPAHDFCRHMVRLKDLIPENVLDLITTATLGSAPYSHFPLPPLPDTHAGWEAGCLLHYPMRSETEAVQYPAALQACFNQNDQTALVGQCFLPATRTLQNQLLETLWDEAHTQLRALATQQERADQWAAAQEEAAFNMPETFQVDGIPCQRLYPSWQARQLLTPEAAPPYAPVQSFLLRQADGTIVKADCGTPLVGLRDFRTPSLLALTLPGQELFAFGDVPIVQGWGVIRLSPEMESAAQAGLFFFPPQQQPLHNTPLENQHYNSAAPLRMVPDESISLPDLVPLPETGVPLSMPSFLRWVATHPWAQALDIRRALLLLGPEEAENLARSVPTIRPFLLQLQGQP